MTTTPRLGLTLLENLPGQETIWNAQVQAAELWCGRIIAHVLSSSGTIVGPPHGSNEIDAGDWMALNYDTRWVGETTAYLPHDLVGVFGGGFVAAHVFPGAHFVERYDGTPYVRSADADLVVFYGQNQIMQLAIGSGTPTSGQIVLDFQRSSTMDVEQVTIDFDATATELRLALEATDQLIAGEVEVSGGPLPGTPLVVEFVGYLRYKAITDLSVASETLDAGTPAVTTIQAGVAIWDQTP